MKQKYLYLGLLIVMLVALIGCKKNIDHISQSTIISEEYTFSAPYKKTWGAAVEAVLEYSAIDTMDQNSGYISSEITTVDGREMDFMDHAFFGQTYKFTYDIRLYAEGHSRTRINTKVKLYIEQFMGISRREDHIAQVENYLREKLYKEICANLYPRGNSPCSSGFYGSSADQVSSTPKPAYKPTPKKPDPEVKFAQEVLLINGYQPGPADGIMGKRTRSAIKDFQRVNGLKVSGNLNQATYTLLQSGNYQRVTLGEKKKNEEVEQAVTFEQSNSEIDNESNTNEQIKLPSTVDIQKLETSTHDAEKEVTQITSKYRTNEESVLLKEPDFYGSEILETIPEGSPLNILSHEGQYYRIKYNGQEGYIQSRSVTEE